MVLVHSAIRQPLMTVKSKTVNPDEARALNRLQQREQRDEQIAIAENLNAVKEIREYQAGWMPGQKIK